MTRRDGRDDSAALPGAEGLEAFCEKILSYYRENGRSFPWRETRNGYEILVSEIMLQQTQTQRVLPRYLPFIRELPSFGACADASIETIFALWKGLGYNRRALALRESSRRIVEDFGGNLPRTREDLLRLPGVGKGTAGALLAFAYDIPVAFLETNIRRVFIHEFFPGEQGVHDRMLLPLVEASLDRRDPRTWYYALMDYGVMLSGTGENANRRSRHYSRQSSFNGSNRQIRGSILKLLSEKGELPVETIVEILRFPEERTRASLKDLENEGFLACEKTVRFRK